MPDSNIYLRGTSYTPERAVVWDMILEESIVKLPDSDIGDLTGKRQIVFQNSVVITPPSWEKSALLRTPYLVIENCGLNLPDIIEAREVQTGQTGCIRVEHPKQPLEKPPVVILSKVSLGRVHLHNFALESSIVEECIIDGSTQTAEFTNSIINKLEFRKGVSLKRLALLGPPPIDFDMGENEYILAEEVVLSPDYIEGRAISGEVITWGDIDIYARRIAERA